MLFLYNKYNFGNKLTLLSFREKLVESLLTPLKPNDPAPRPVANQHIPSKFQIGPNGRPLRRRCVECNTKRVRKDTTYFCGACDDKPALCLGQCFETYHK